MLNASHSNDVQELNRPILGGDDGAVTCRNRTKWGVYPQETT